MPSSSQKQHVSVATIRVSTGPFRWSRGVELSRWHPLKTTPNLFTKIAVVVWNVEKTSKNCTILEKGAILQTQNYGFHQAQPRFLKARRNGGLFTCKISGNHGTNWMVPRLLHLGFFDDDDDDDDDDDIPCVSKTDGQSRVLRQGVGRCFRESPWTNRQSW